MSMPGRLLFVFAYLLLVCCKNSDSKEPIAVEQSQDINTDTMQIAESPDSKDRDVWQNPDYIISLLGDLSDKTVADLGAGSGYFSMKLVPKAKKVIALDIDRHFIQYMNQKVSEYSSELKNKFEARLVKTDDPMLKDNEVQLVLVANTYIYIQDRIEYFTRLRNAISPGGKLYIIDFKKTKLPVGPPESIKLSTDQIIQELTQSGFKHIKSDENALKYQNIISAENIK